VSVRCGYSTPRTEAMGPSVFLHANFHEKALFVKADLTMFACRRSRLRQCPGATLVAEIASEVLRTKERIATLDARLSELVEAHPKGKVLMSLPGMGIIMTAEFLAEAENLSRFGSPDRFAAAVGIAPVLRASGSVSYRRRAKRGNRVLKRVFYQSTHCAVPRAEQDLLPAQTFRGERTHSGRDRPGKEESQCSLGDAARRHLQRGPNASGRLTRLENDIRIHGGLVAVEPNGFCPSRYASIRTFSESTLFGDSVHYEIRLDSGYY
jgi:Transposase IS116/IS110/IS902 family